MRIRAWVKFGFTVRVESVLPCMSTGSESNPYLTDPDPVTDTDTDPHPDTDPTHGL